MHIGARISAWAFDEELALGSLCLTAAQAPSLGQLVGPQLTEGVAGPGFLFLLLSAACHLLVGGEKLDLSCDAPGRVR